MTEAQKQAVDSLADSILKNYTEEQREYLIEKIRTTRQKIIKAERSVAQGFYAVQTSVCPSCRRPL